MPTNLTVGHIRKAIAGLPDNAPVCPDWAGGPPSDHEPGVELIDVACGQSDRRGQYLSIRVALFYLDEDDQDDETLLRIFYKCPECGHEWEEWTSACDSECPECETKNISPVRYEELDDDEESEPVEPHQGAHDPESCGCPTGRAIRS
jgi:predicted Zn-ribbon and HTH transcriptional regulator